MKTSTNEATIESQDIQYNKNNIPLSNPLSPSHSKRASGDNDRMVHPLMVDTERNTRERHRNIDIYNKDMKRTNSIDDQVSSNIPEVLQKQHIEPFTNLSPTSLVSLSDLEDDLTSILTPLNSITPPSCHIEPKGIANVSYLKKHEDGRLELADVPAASFFDIFDIKSIGPFKLVKTLGAGSTGKVKLAIHERTGQKIAVKIVPREPATPFVPKSPNEDTTTAGKVKKKKDSRESKLAKEARLLREISLLSLLHHPHIVTLYGYTYTKHYYLLFMEFVEGGQLLNHVIQHGKLKEDDARSLFRQLLSAVQYCHANSVVHRDLKIENILLNNDDAGIGLKLIDFGLSNFYDSSLHLSTFCGSLYYAAPELLSGRPYTGPEVDIWSLGIILYVLTTGKVPFDDKKLPILHEKIKAGKVEYPSHLSNDCKSLLSSMLRVSPMERLTLSQIIQHDWVSSHGTLSSVHSFLPVREPLVNLDARIVYGVSLSLGHQYSMDLIYRILSAAKHDWNHYRMHPMVSLYYLVREKFARILNDNEIENFEYGGANTKKSSLDRLCFPHDMTGALLRRFTSPIIPTDPSLAPVSAISAPTTQRTSILQHPFEQQPNVNRNPPKETASPCKEVEASPSHCWFLPKVFKMFRTSKSSKPFKASN